MHTNTARLTAPAGWGYPPGYPLGEISADHLPDLPMLQLCSKKAMLAAIRDAVASLPYIHAVRPSHLVARYGIPRTTAISVLQHALSRTPSNFGRMNARHPL